MVRTILITSALMFTSCYPVSFAQDSMLDDMFRVKSFARTTTVYEDTLGPNTQVDTTTWFQLVPDQYERYPEIWGDHQYWTLFARVDSVETPAPAVNLSIEFEVAVNRDQAGTGGDYIAYRADDGSSSLLTISTYERVFKPVTVYGGLYGRFILTSTDSLRVELNLWKKH